LVLPALMIHCHVGELEQGSGIHRPHNTLLEVEGFAQMPIMPE
jgi:hypothetical protein